MLVQTQGIICSSRNHGEHGAVVRILTPDKGLLAGYVRGARSRTLRPILIPANRVSAVFSGRDQGQLPSLTVELMVSRGALLSEALATAGLEWSTGVASAILPENHPYPAIYQALDGLIEAIAMAPNARRWAGALTRYEQILLTELGFGEEFLSRPIAVDWPEIVDQLNATGERLGSHLLYGRQIELLDARTRLTDRLKRAVA